MAILLEVQSLERHFFANNGGVVRPADGVAFKLPIICLVTPGILVGASAPLRNLRPAILEPYTLCNAEQLFFR